MSYFLSRDVLDRTKYQEPLVQAKCLQRFTQDPMSYKRQTDLENVNSLIWTEYLCPASPFIR